MSLNSRWRTRKKGGNIVGLQIIKGVMKKKKTTTCLVTSGNVRRVECQTSSQKQNVTALLSNLDLVGPDPQGSSVHSHTDRSWQW